MLLNQFFLPAEVKTSLNKRLKLKMREWLLPYWYEGQNDPIKPAYYVGKGDFRNFTCRNWTELRTENSGEMLQIDRYGVIYLPKHRISVESWIHTGDKLYTPGNYRDILQKTSYDGFIETISYYDDGYCRCRITPSVDSDGESISCNISLYGRNEDALKQLAIYLVLRPYDYNGLSVMQSIEYRENWLLINGTRVLFLEKEPTHCYFTDGLESDVTQYFKLGEGNSRFLASDGLGTGIIGYSGLPADLDGVKIFFAVKRKFFNNGRFHLADRPAMNISGCINNILTGTLIDQLLAANLFYLKTFCSPPLLAISFFQILALNRFSNGMRSRYFLRKCLRKIRWDGSLSERFLGPEKLILATADYLKLTNDYYFIMENWPALKQAGYCIWHQKADNIPAGNNPGRQTESLFDRDGCYERLFWIGAALKALMELARTLGQAEEASIYKEQFAAFWSKLMGLLTNITKCSGSRIIPFDRNGGLNAGIIKNLAAAYPLQLWEPGNSYITGMLEFISHKYMYRGGVFSPFDFQGIDLAYSIKMALVMLREGYDYSKTFELLIASAGGAWSWPDRIHPLTMSGVGEKGHDPEVLYQVLLLIRNILILEERDFLDLLPGIFNSSFWEHPQLVINKLATYFGEISLKCDTIGDLTQIEFHPQYRVKPQKVRLYLCWSYRPVYADAEFKMIDSTLEIDPDFQILHLKRVKSVGLS